MEFLDRTEELARLVRTVRSKTGSLCCVYGRRRCGKSRLLKEALAGATTVLHVADQMEPSMQRARLARDISPLVPGIDRATYPDWSSLFDRWADAAAPGTCLVLDEFPYLAEKSPELPSILQRIVDRLPERGVHLVLCGSSQRMMQGLVLDAAAPLYGRSREILKVAPLPFGWAAEAFRKSTPLQLLERYAVFGGVPRYWELAADYSSNEDAIRDLVLSPLGVLHNEPRHLLLDDLADVAQAASVLALIGQGCCRLSEIAGRLGKPATSLTRPLSRLLELDFVVRETPFGADERNGKKSLYRLADPFLAFWYRLVQPNLSAFARVPPMDVWRPLREPYRQHVADVFETLARRAAPRLKGGVGWGEAKRWWGAGRDGIPLELDIVVSSQDGRRLLVGEAKRKVHGRDVARLHAELRAKAGRLPFVHDSIDVQTCLFAAESDGAEGRGVVGLPDLLACLR